MTYQAWTAKAVELRVVEAAETLMLTPNTYGSSSAWPQIVRSADESYGYGSSWYKKRPSAGALDRMLVTWSWINALPSQEDRQLLYAWAWTKVKRGRFLSDFAAREGANSKTIRRAITRICQRIADDLNQKHVAWLNNRVDDVSEILAYEPTDSLLEAQPERSPTHIMTPDAKPASDLSAETAALIAKQIEQSNKRLRKMRRRDRRSL
jgi:hypothetical protein